MTCQFWMGFQRQTRKREFNSGDVKYDFALDLKCRYFSDAKLLTHCCGGDFGLICSGFRLSLLLVIFHLVVILNTWYLDAVKSVGDVVRVTERT